MPTTEPNTVSLPLLPIEVGVVLPQMVVTLAPDTDEAKQAIEAASTADGLLLLVPRIDGRYAKVGTVARVDEVGQLPNGQQAVLLRGLSRAVVGTGVAGTSPGLWVQAERIEDPTVATGGLTDLARELRGVVSALAERRRSRRLPEALASATEPGALADAVAGGWTDLPVARAVEVLETLDVEGRVRKVLGWARDALAEHEGADQIRTDVAEGMERTQREFLLRQQLAAIRKELGEPGDAQGPVAEDRAKGGAAHPPADGGAPGPSWRWSGHGAWARPRWGSPWPGRWDASSCASPWVGCTTRPRSVATAAPTWAPPRGASCAPSGRPGP